MSITLPPQGTHFSDGVRVGPILTSQYVAGNGLNPSSLISTPESRTAPGIYTTPMSLLNIIPAPVATASLAAPQTPAGLGYLTLVTASGQGATLLTYQSIPNVIQLDTPRNIIIQGIANVTAANYTVFGWDQYGIPLVEQITGPVGATQTVGKKAFLYVRAVYVSAGTVANVSVGVGNVFGLGHLVTNSNYIGIPQWAGNPDLDTSVTLANNPITTANASATVTVTVPASPGTGGLIVGQLVLITGAAAIGAITAPQLNIQAEIASIPNGTTFTYVSAGTANSTGAGGGAAVIISYASVSAGLEGTFVPGAQAIATAITGDVRGTYSPSSNANGSARLTINYYNASGDTRNYYNANNGTIILNADPITTVNATATVTVFAPNHQLVGNETVTISGAATTNNITAAQLNIQAPITIVDANNFTYVSNGTANASSAGGGALVSMTPQYGTLYQTPTGRFGVPQYSVALF